MEELLKEFSLDNIIFSAFFLGIAFNIINDLLMAITNYINERAWISRDYEKAFYELYKYNPYILNVPCHKLPDFKYVLLGAIRRHKKRLNNKNKFKNLFKKKKEND